MKIKRKITLALVGALSLGCLCLGALHIKAPNSISVSATTAVVFMEGAQIKQVYKSGDSFTPPSAKIAYEGAEYPANENVTLYYPDGEAYEGTVFSLRQAGEYRLIYSATVEGKLITAEKNFRVEAIPYAVPGSSNVEYLETLKTQNPSKQNGGINVGLSIGSTFTYNKTVDLKNASLDTPVITFTPYQCSQYILDSENNPMLEVKEFTLRITDAYDKNNFVDVYMLSRNTTPIDATRFAYPYASAGANGQTLYALDDVSRWQPTSNNGKIVTVNGAQYCAVYKNFGYSLGNVPLGATLGEEGNGGSISVYYDAEEKAVYLSSVTKLGNGTQTRMVLLNDLDDTGLYINPFKGFTTGEVYLSIFGNDYLTDSFNFEISEIYGTKGSALNDEVNVVDDKREPTILFDREIPEILYVQKDSKVSILPVQVYDIHSRSTAISVWYNYGSAVAERVNVKNGVFVPTKSGVYTVEYRATDAYGNEAVETVAYTCIADKALSFTVDKITDGVKAGSVLSIPQGVGNSRNGVVSTKISVLCGATNEITVIDESLKYLVEYAGNYTLTYEYSDGFATETKTDVFTATASEMVNISTPLLPEYFIKDASYTLDTVYASTYTEGKPVLKNVKTFVSEDGKEYKEIDYTNYKVAASETVQFRYDYEDTKTLSLKLPVVDVGFEGKSNIEKESYFIGDVSGVATDSSVVLTATKTGEAEFSFVNVLSFDSFSFEFSVPKNAGFNGLEITIIDYYERTNSLVFQYEKKGESTAFRYNDVATEIAKSFEGNPFSISYISSAKQLVERNGFADDYFPTFTGDRILLRVKMFGATAESSKLAITMVGNQSFNSNPRDNTQAYVTYQNLFSGYNKPGSKATIYSLDAIDVLSPYLMKNGTVTVYMPGEDMLPATSVDGITLANVPANRNYEIALDKIGEYRVSYIYLDQKNNSNESNYVITSANDTAPVLTLKEGFTERTIEKVKVGAKVNLIGYTATDDATKQEDLKVITYVLQANGEFLMLEETFFYANQAGDYIVYYYCYDADNNYTIMQYTVRAS